MIYLDNAATTYPKPPTVRRAVDEAFAKYYANPGRGGYDASRKSAEAVFSCRSKLGAFFNCPADRVVFTHNCTTAMNICLRGLLRPGDHVICSSLEHNAVMRPLFALHETGVEVDVAEAIFGDMEATLHSFRNLIRKNTRLIVCTHASNLLGAVFPIAGIGALCRENGLLFVVDAAQSAGILDIDMQQMQIDYLCVAGHKGLYAPMGTGVLLCRGDCPRPLILGGTGTNSRSMEQPDDLPERLESGTLSLPGILGLSAGVDFVRQKTPDRIYSHELMLMQKAYRGLNGMRSVMLYTPLPEKGLSVPVMPFNIAGLSSEETADYLGEKGIAVRAGLHCAPSAHKRIGTLDIGAVRIAPSAFSTPEDINKLLNVVERLNQKQKYARKY